MLSFDSIAKERLEVNKKISISSDNDMDISILSRLLDVLGSIDIKDQLEGIRDLCRYILSRKKRKIKSRKTKIRKKLLI